MSEEIWKYNHRPGMTLWQYTYIDEEGNTIHQFRSYIRRTLSQLEEICPNHDDILMEIIPEEISEDELQEEVFPTLFED